MSKILSTKPRILWLKFNNILNILNLVCWIESCRMKVVKYLKIFKTCGPKYLLRALWSLKCQFSIEVILSWSPAPYLWIRRNFYRDTSQLISDHLGHLEPHRWSSTRPELPLRIVTGAIGRGFWSSSRSWFFGGCSCETIKTQTGAQELVTSATL